MTEAGDYAELYGVPSQRQLGNATLDLPAGTRLFDFQNPTDADARYQNFPLSALSTDSLQQALRGLGEATVPQRQGALLEALSNFQQLANGGSAATLDAIRPQAQALRQQFAQAFQQLGQRLGPQAGGQTQRDQGALLGQFAQQLQQLLFGAQSGGLKGQYNLLSTFRPSLLSTLPQLTQSSNPSDLSGLSSGIADALRLGQFAYNQFNTPSSSTVDLGFGAIPVANGGYGGVDYGGTIDTGYVPYQ